VNEINQNSDIPINCKRANEVRNPQKVGHLFGDETTELFIEALRGKPRDCASSSPCKACERRKGENLFIFGSGQTLKGLKPQRVSAI
jgi:hypothetical protein